MSLNGKKILIAGASGFIGSALYNYFKSLGGIVFTLSHSKKSNSLFWNPDKGEIDQENLENFDAIINLSGTNIFTRWTSNNKKLIYSSRINSSRLLASNIANLKNKPKVFINASAVGYYGIHPKNPCDENSASGDDFLAKTCFDWENSCKDAIDAGVRTVFIRQGSVLSKSGAMLKVLAPVFKLWLGAKFGSGKQNMAWITMGELCKIYEFAILNETVFGALNVVSPKLAKNEDFAKALAQALNAPLLFSIPSFVIKLIFGKMGESLILADQIIEPKKLLDSRFKFDEDDIYAKLKKEFK